MIHQVEKTSRVILSEPFKDIKEPKQKKTKKKAKDKTAQETEVTQMHETFQTDKELIICFTFFLSCLHVLTHFQTKQHVIYLMTFSFTSTDILRMNPLQLRLQMR